MAGRRLCDDHGLRKKGIPMTKPFLLAVLLAALSGCAAGYHSSSACSDGRETSSACQNERYQKMP
jgi:hypothetical protein